VDIEFRSWRSNLDSFKASIFDSRRRINVDATTVPSITNGLDGDPAREAFADRRQFAGKPSSLVGNRAPSHDSSSESRSSTSH
jgi:hypothetical protein